MWIYYRLYFNTVPGAYQTRTEFASRIIPLSPFNEKLDSHGRRGASFITALRFICVSLKNEEWVFAPTKSNRSKCDSICQSQHFHLPDFIFWSVPSVFCVSQFSHFHSNIQRKSWTDSLPASNPVLFKFLICIFIRSHTCSVSMRKKWMN